MIHTTTSKLAEALGVDRAVARGLLNAMVDLNLLEVDGRLPSTRGKGLGEISYRVPEAAPTALAQKLEVAFGIR